MLCPLYLLPYHDLPCCIMVLSSTMTDHPWKYPLEIRIINRIPCAEANNAQLHVTLAIHRNLQTLEYYRVNVVLGSVSLF